MHVVAEMLAAIVVVLAAAVFSWFGMTLASSEAAAERSVRRVPASASAAHTVAPRTNPDAQIPC